MENKKEKLEVIKREPEMSLQLIDPEEQVKFGQRAAKALVRIVESKKQKLVLNGKTYLNFEDWQTIGRFYNLTVGIDWTKEINREGRLLGFEAKANVYNASGTIISSAEASCLRDEPNWCLKPEFQLKSMSQTRASAKALRNVLAWVVVLAGYEPTPSEEMEGIKGKTFHPKHLDDIPTIQVGEYGEPVTPFPTKNLERNLTCSECKGKITDAEIKYSRTKYGFAMCKKCQMSGKYKPKA
jgi:hypothetical protein